MFRKAALLLRKFERSYDVSTLITVAELLEKNGEKKYAKQVKGIVNTLDKAQKAVKVVFEKFKDDIKLAKELVREVKKELRNYNPKKSSEFKSILRTYMKSLDSLVANWESGRFLKAIAYYYELKKIKLGKLPRTKECKKLVKLLDRIRDKLTGAFERGVIPRFDKAVQKVEELTKAFEKEAKKAKASVFGDFEDA